MLLKPGAMHDHEGTYIESVGFAFHDHSVLVELLADDSMAGVQAGNTLYPFNHEKGMPSHP